MPREGYTKLFEKMLDHPNIDIKTDTEFTDILWIQDNAFIYNSSVFKGEVIFTGMIDELFDFKFGNLPYRSIELVFENHLVKSFQNMTTTNYPNDYDYTRITEFKKMYDAKNATTTIAKEYPQEFIYGQNTPS